MFNLLKIFMLLVIFIGISNNCTVNAENTKRNNSNYDEILLRSDKGVETDATFFSAKGKEAVILAPGAMFSKASWYFLAKRLQQKNIAAIAINSGSTPDLLNALTFFKKKHYETITLIGASMGGMGVLDFLHNHIVSQIVKVVLLAPAGGKPLKSNTIRKLFIAAEDDMIVSNVEVYNIYDESNDPKIFKEFEGSAHAQRLFDSEHREKLIVLILEFISPD